MEARRKKQLEAAVRAERVHVKELRCNERLDERRQSDETVERMKSLIAEEKEAHGRQEQDFNTLKMQSADAAEADAEKMLRIREQLPVYERLGEAVEREQQAKQAYESAKQYYERAVREGASRLLAEKTGSFYWRKSMSAPQKRGSGHPPGPRRRLRNMSTCTSCF